MSGQGLGLLKIDFKNAFNTVDRGAFLAAVKDKFPRLASWAYWCYEGPSSLLYDKRHVIKSASGVQQGDPLGPLLFCCALAPLIAEIQHLGPAYNKWYMDDGGIIGTPALLQQVWDILRVKGPSIGLILNPTWIDGTDQPCPVMSGLEPSGMPVVLPEDVCMLGVPMGPVSSASTFVKKKLLGGRMQVLSRLCDFEDAQAAFFLLRTSFSIVRATHFMRTTPLDLARGSSRVRRESEGGGIGYPGLHHERPSVRPGVPDAEAGWHGPAQGLRARQRGLLSKPRGGRLYLQ